MRNIHSVIGIILISLIIILGSVYIYHQSENFLKGPVITLENRTLSPQTEPFFTLSGHAANVAFLSLNGRQIFTDEKGVFSEKLLLLSGYNIIQITARDKFGRDETKTIELVYTPPVSLATTTIQ